MGDGLLSSGLQALLKDADADPPAMITPASHPGPSCPNFLPTAYTGPRSPSTPKQPGSFCSISWSIVKTKTSYYGFLETSLLFFNLKI